MIATKLFESSQIFRLNHWLFGRVPQIHIPAQIVIKGKKEKTDKIEQTILGSGPTGLNFCHVKI